MLKRILSGMGTIFLIAAILLVLLFFRALQHWAAIHTGTLNEPGPYYGFFSGFGSDLGEYAIAASVIGTAAGMFRKHNCHVKGCWRLQKHHVEGTAYIVCKKHHPALPDEDITAEHVREAHEKRRR